MEHYKAKTYFYTSKCWCCHRKRDERVAAFGGRPLSEIQKEIEKIEHKKCEDCHGKMLFYEFEEAPILKTINYRDLLKKYMCHIDDREGTMFLQEHSLRDTNFSDQEKELLKTIEAEINDDY